MEWTMSMKLLISFSLVTIFSFSMGSLYGYKEGMNDFSAIEHVAVGSLATVAANNIRKDTETTRDKAIGLLETNINAGLDGYIRYKDGLNPILSEVYFGDLSWMHEQGIKSLIKYRKNHPEIDLTKILKESGLGEGLDFNYKKRMQLLSTYAE